MPVALNTTTSAQLPFNTWQPPQPPNASTSTNDRCVTSYVNSHITPLVPAGRGRSGRSNRGGRAAGGTARGTTDELPQSYIFDIGILGYPVSMSCRTSKCGVDVCQLSGTDNIDDDIFFRKIWGHRVPELLEQMDQHHLLLNVNTTALPRENATTFLSRTILNHLVTYNLTMPGSPRPPVFPSDGQSLDQVNFYLNPWQLVVVGYRRTSREGAAHKLTSSTIPYHLMTWHNLLSGAPTTSGKELARIHNVHDRPLIFIGMILSACLIGVVILFQV
jgi:hypothetical protein